MAAENVVIVGGSITGLSAALAFEQRGFHVTVVERDPAPDPGLTAEESARWPRRGAAHTMQPHFFLAARSSNTGVRPCDDTVRISRHPPATATRA
jgi:glycine/D-amino acid oxidase-like deaminating enzyme